MGAWAQVWKLTIEGVVGSLGCIPEVTKAVALVLLLGALTVVPPRHRLLTVFMLPGRTTAEDGALGAEATAVEKAAEDAVLSTPACWQKKRRDMWLGLQGRQSWSSHNDGSGAEQPRPVLGDSSEPGKPLCVRGHCNT